jgi:hypothetical protein
MAADFMSEIMRSCSLDDASISVRDATWPEEPMIMNCANGLVCSSKTDWRSNTLGKLETQTFLSVSALTILSPLSLSYMPRQTSWWPKRVLYTPLSSNFGAETSTPFLEGCSLDSSCSAAAASVADDVFGSMCLRISYSGIESCS